MVDYRLTEADRDSLLSDLDDLASRAGGILSRATRPRTLLRGLEPWEPETDPLAREGWVLVEDVDLSDPAGWTMETGTAKNTASQDIPENVEFSAEGLRIWGRNEVSPNESPYTSGDALGKGHPIPNYARVEVVGRGPNLKGLWPAILWLRPLTGSIGEIDLMENFGGSYNQVAATLHDGYDENNMHHGNLKWAALDDSDPEAFHTYVMEKTPGRIKIECDGVTMIDVGPNVSNPVASSVDSDFRWDETFEVPGQTWYPRVTMQVGCGTSNPTCATGFPGSDWIESDLLVTDIRIYAQEE